MQRYLYLESSTWRTLICITKKPGLNYNSRCKLLKTLFCCLFFFLERILYDKLHSTLIELQTYHKLYPSNLNSLESVSKLLYTCAVTRRLTPAKAWSKGAPSDLLPTTKI